MAAEVALTGKRALVTGGSRGIGRGIALRLAERGARVAVNYLQDEAAAARTLAGVRERGAQGLVVQADVTRPEAIAGMFARVKEAFGGLDIFVSNALGDLLGFMAPPLACTLEQWEAAHAAQTRAFFVGAREAAGLLADGGRILAVSYWPGSHTGGFLPYFAMGANKAALEAMCRYFAVALAPRGITVNAVCPGITDDSIVNRLPPEAQAAMLAWLRRGWTPMGRPGTPADVGGAVAALCAADAGWITGQTIAVDGGASLMNPEVPLELQRG
jgi:NAD(P)-dependent dehydrogenase (short-subunit alcohol dehydrogenase family)